MFKKRISLKKLFTIFMAAAFLSLLLIPSSFAGNKLGIEVEGEFGAGHLITLGANYQLSQFYVGLSSAYDTGSFKVLDKKYNESLINISAVGGWHFFKQNKITTEVYTKIGYEMYFVDKYSAKSLFLSPGLKASYSLFFVDCALPMLIGLDNPVTLFQLGLGIRYQL